MNTNCSKDRKEFYTDFRLRTSDGKIALTNKFTMYFVELPKIPEKALENLTKLEKWLLFLKYEGGKEMAQVLEREPMIARAMTVAEVLAKDRHEQMLAQYREDAIRDEYWRMSTSLDQGIAIGETRGKLGTARKLLAMGLNFDMISQATGLTEAQLKAPLAEGGVSAS